MPRITPAVRLGLTALAAVVGVLVSVQDQLPTTVQGIVIGADVVLAAVGITPPHVTILAGPTRQVNAEPSPPPPAAPAAPPAA